MTAPAGRSPRRPTLRARLAMAALATLLGLAALEVLARLVVPPGAGMGSASADAPNARLYGWALPPSSRLPLVDPDSGRVWTYRTNAAGWKDVEHDRARPPGTRRILVVGDSYTFGVVPLEAQFGRQLQELLDHDRRANPGAATYEVITLGVPGWGTDQALEALLREGLAYRPDWVIYQFCANDLTDNLYPDPDPALAPPNALHLCKTFRYRLGHDGTLERVALDEGASERRGPRARSALRRLVRHSALATLLVRTVQSVARRASAAEPEPADRQRLDPSSSYFCFAAEPDADPPGTRRAWALLEALLVRMDREVRAAGAELAVFCETGEAGHRRWLLDRGIVRTDAAGDHVLAGGRRVPIDLGRPYRRLNALCDAHGIAFIPRRRSYPRYRNDSHADPEGNRQIALDLRDFVLDRDAARR